MDLMIKVCTPENSQVFDVRQFGLFLAGTIEMGDSRNWQQDVIYHLHKKFNASMDLTIWNPRRESWDSSWEQSIHNPQFKDQVQWELFHLEASNIRVFWFEAESKSPITLMELGIASKLPGSSVIYCPDGFWRKGNVEVIADYASLGPVYNTEKDFLVGLETELVKVYDKMFVRY